MSVNRMVALAAHGFKTFPFLALFFTSFQFGIALPCRKQGRDDDSAMLAITCDYLGLPKSEFQQSDAIDSTEQFFAADARPIECISDGLEGAGAGPIRKRRHTRARR